MMLKFPKGFMWGSAMSALQSEGAGITRSGKHTWNLISDKRPEVIFGQASPYTGVDSMRHYKEDLALMAKYGHNSFRNSFSWARLFPDGENVDPKAVAYYHDFLAEAKRNGLKRIMTLMHFDMPEFFHKKKGFLSPDYPSAFAKYADFIFGEYGNDVEIFATYNEPHVQLTVEVAFGESYPELKGDNQAFVDCAVSLAYSHALAVNLFNEKYRGKIPAQISYVHSVSVALPKDEKTYTPADEQAAKDIMTISNFLFMDPMINGEYGSEVHDLIKRFGLKLKVTKEIKDAISKVRLDAIGVNFYTIARTLAPSSSPRTIYERAASGYKLEGARMNRFRGWEIYPKGLYIATQLIKNRYKNIPSWIGENGMGVQEEWRYMDKEGFVSDDYRIALISEHLEWVHKSIQDGANCTGYHVWSTYDCYSMTNGYKNTYGLIRVDIQTMKRFPKKSAFWLADVKKNNGFESDYKKLEEVMDINKSSVIESSNYGHRVMGAAPKRNS